MGTLISPIILTRLDRNANPWVDVYAIYEYRDASSGLPNGETIDLSNFMRRVEYIDTQPISGQFYVESRPQAADYPGNAGSGRMEAYFLTSAIITLNLSGIGISIASGQIIAASAAIQSGVTASFLFSGRITAQGSGALAIGTGSVYAQLLSGTLISGSRAYIHAFGY